MTTVNAHFDGKVIIPDEPLDLPPNQPLIVSIEPVAERQGAAEESVLSWLAANAVESNVLPTDLPTGTTTTFTDVPRRTKRSSGNLLRRHFLLDRTIEQTRPASFPRC